MEPRTPDDTEAERLYIVQWKASLIKLSDVDSYAILLHEFWTEVRDRKAQTVLEP
jgi:hypothetical protein